MKFRPWACWALAALIPVTLAGPVQQSTCVTECRTPLEPKFGYLAGQAYIYNFQATTTTTVTGTTEDQAVLGVKGQATVTFRGPCDGVLTLSQTSITWLQGRLDSTDLEKRSIAFSFQDGTIDAVCASEEELPWVLNVKKAVLSMLQHTAISLATNENFLIENDIVGRCPTNYTSEGSLSGTATITKSKNPNTCSNRIGRHSAIPSVPYLVPAELQTLPLLDSSSFCIQKIRNSLIANTNCKESHLFRPFSSAQGGGLRSEVTTELTFRNAVPSRPISIGSNLVRGSLLYDPKGARMDGENEKDGITNLMQQICTQLSAGNIDAIPHLFNQLVYAVRQSNANELKAVFYQVKNAQCKEASKREKIFLDALPAAGSPAAVSLMADLLLNNQVSERQAYGWYVSLPLAKFASSDSVKALLPILDKNPIALATLSISAFAKRYCALPKTKCESDANIQQLVAKLAQHLGNRCKVAKPDDERKVLAALKALGNVGILPSNVYSSVESCISEVSLPLTTRLAAIDALRNNPCHPQGQAKLVSVLSNLEEDVEVRIAAYKSLMLCPSGEILLSIHQVLMRETSNQVGSFIASHLDNLKSNRNPGKQAVHELVQSLSHNASFPTDSRKFSRNYNLADFCSVHNLGIDVDTDVVFSPKAFSPRSISVNLTLDIFGQSVNLFELGARVEGLESLLESLVGPEGLWATKGGDSDGLAHSLFNSLNSLRSKRAAPTKQDLATFNKLPILQDPSDLIRADGFLRVFGSELGLLTFRGRHLSDIPYPFVALFDKGLDVAFNDRVDVARSLMFLDTSISFPTVAGFPLKLALNGTTSISLALESTSDDKLIKLNLSPAAATQISAVMSVEAGVARTGIKLVTVAHTSVSVISEVKLKPNVEIKVNLPRDKLTLLEVKSELLLVNQKALEGERSRKVLVKNDGRYVRGSCSENLTPLFGLKTCAKYILQVPTPLQGAQAANDNTPVFPLSGHGVFSIGIEKDDTAIQGYTLGLNFKQQGAKYTVSLDYDVIGSKQNRKLSFKGTALAEKGVYSVELKDLTSPWTKMNIEGEIILRERLEKVLVKIERDGKEYFGRLQFDVKVEGKKITYLPILEYGSPQTPKSVILDAKLALLDNKVDWILKTAGSLSQYPLGFEGGLEYKDGADSRIAFKDVKVITPIGKAAVSGHLAREGRKCSTALDLKYGAANHAVKLAADFEDLSPLDGKKFKTAVNYQSTRFPFTNLNAKWDYQRTSDSLDNNLVVVHGAPTEAAKNKFTLVQSSICRGKLETTIKVINKLDVSYPATQFSLKLDQTFNKDEKKATGLLNFDFATKRLLSAELNVDIKADTPNALTGLFRDTKFKYDGTAKITYPGRTVLLKETLEKSGITYNFKGSVESQPGDKYEYSLQGTLDHTKDHIHDLQGEIKFKSPISPIKVRHTLLVKHGVSYKTENKVEWSGQPQIVLDTTIEKQGDLAASLKAFYGGRVDAQLGGKWGAKEKKAEISLNLLRLQRHVKTSITLKPDGETTKWDASIAWDVSKDPKLRLGSEGSLKLPVKENAFEFKTNLDILSQKYTMSSKANLDKGTVGEHSAEWELVYPTGKKATVAWKADNKWTSSKMGHKATLEAKLSSGDEYKLSVNTKISDMDAAKGTYTAVADLSLKTPEWKDLAFYAESKRTYPSGKRLTENKINFKAPHFGPNMDWSGKEELSKDSFKSQTQYARGPSTWSAETVAKWSFGKTKTVLEASLDIKIPQTSLQNLKIAFNSATDTGNGKFEMKDKVSVTYQTSKNIVFDLQTKVAAPLLDLSLTLDTTYDGFKQQSLVFNGKMDSPVPVLQTSLHLLWSPANQRTKKEIRVDFKVEKKGGTVDVTLAVLTPVVGYETISVIMNGKALNYNRRIEFAITGAAGASKSKLDGHYELSPTSRDLGLTLLLPTGRSLRLTVKGSAQAPAYGLEVKYDSDRGTESLKANSKFQNWDSFDTSVSINSPSLGISEYEILTSSKQAGAQRKIELTVKRKNVVTGSLKGSYDRKDTKTGYELKGSADVSMKEPNLNGGLKWSVETKDGEYGFNVDTSGDLTPVTVNKASGVVKLLPNEKSITLLGCENPQKCHEYVISHVNIAKGSESGFDTIVHRKVTDGKNEDLTGLRVRLNSLPTKVEHSLELSISSKVIGYKLYGQDAATYGFELKTPSRTAAATVGFAMVAGRAWKLNGQAQTEVTLTVWLDKVRQADKKLVLILSSRPDKDGILEGYVLGASLKHPALSRSLDFNLEAYSGPPPVLYHVKIEADAFSASHGKWSAWAKVRVEPVGNGVKYISEAELKSQGKNLAIQFRRESLTTDDRVQRDVNLKFLEAGIVDKELFVKIDVARNHVDLAVGSPQRQIALNGNWKVSSFLGYPRVEAAGSTTVLSLAPSTYKLDLSLIPKADVRISNRASPENYYQLVGGLLNEEHFELGLKRLVGATKNDLATLSVTLKPPRGYQTRVVWNTEQLRALLQAAQQRGKLVREEVGVTLSALSGDVGSHLGKWNSFEKLGADAQKLVTEYAQQFAALKAELAKEESVQQLVRVGTALASSFKTVGDAITVIADNVEDLVSKLITVVGVVTEKVIAYTAKLVTHLPQIVGKLAADTMEAVVTLSLKTSRIVWAALEIPLHVVMQYTEDALKRYGLVDAAKSVGEALRSVRGWINDQVQHVVVWIQSWVKTGSTTGAWQNVQDLVKRIQSFDPLQTLLNILEEALFQPIDSWKLRMIQSYPELTRPLNRWHQRTIGKVRILLTQKAGPTKPWQWQEELSAMWLDLVEVDVKGGKVISNVFLPYSVRSLRQLVTVKYLASDPLTLDSLDKYTGPQDLLYKSLAHLNPELIPSRWRGQALLIGSQGYYTFDDKFYDFASNCHYLLARDFRDGNFTITINYEDSKDSPRKTIVVTDATDVVEFGSDYKVTVNGKSATLPAVLNKLTVSRDWNSVSVKRGKGLTVSCNIPLDVCVLEVSPFYFGKTSGLLGTFNNEESDDWLTASGKKAANVEQFASSWKLSSKCKEKPQVLPPVTAASTAAQEECQKLLDSEDSALRPCFGVVSTSSFYDYCVKVVNKAKKPEAQSAALCSVAGAYATLCRNFGVPVSVPASCSGCEGVSTKEMNFKATDAIEIPLPSKSDKADVILVVEQDSCNQELIKDNFALLTGELESELKLKGMSSVNFGLIGYGGPKLTQAHVYTTLKDDVVFDKKSKNMDVGKAAKEVDSLEAIEKAAAFPFRLGATKSIVVLACHKCSQQSHVDYDTLRDNLLESGIALHIITAEDIKLRGAKNKKLEAQVIGYDAVTTYNLNSAKKKNQLEGDEVARKPVTPSQDVCVNLAQEVRGSVFTATRLTALSKPAQKKPFYTVLGRRLAEGASSSVAACRRCSCVSRDAGYAQSLCRPCQVPEPLTVFKDYEALNFD